MAASQLESHFLATQEDFDKIITSSRAMLKEDKEDLQIQAEQGYHKSKSILKDARVRDKGNSPETGVSINLGGFEKHNPKQKQLSDERHRDYIQYLQDQKFRSGRSNTDTYTDTRGENKQALSSKEEMRRQADIDYKNLVKKKQEQEKVYRVQFNTSDDKKSEEVYVLDSTDKDIIELIRSKRRGKSADKNRSEKFKDMRGEFSENGRSSSVPPNVPPILGGNSNTRLNKERQKQYKLELEQQIQEKEMLKAKEKLKRLGRVTSDCDVNDIEIPKGGKNKWALPVRRSETASTNNRDEKQSSRRSPEHQKYQEHQQQNHQQQQQQFMSNYAQNQQYVNPYYPPQAYAMNPMYGNMQPMAPNPMMQWQASMQQPAFQPMMGGGPFNNSSGAQMMHGYQQGWGEPPQNNNNNNTQRKNSARSRKNWDIPTLDLDGSTNRNDYVPSQPEDKLNIPRRPNVQPPGGGSHGLFNSPISKNDDSAAQKRARQIEYQMELKKQVEIKKEKQQKAKAEEDRYEQKLEQEVHGYDPWGRDGGGAPVRNKDGHVVANLKKYQKDGDTTTNNNTARHVQFDNPSNNDYAPDHEDGPVLKALAESMNRGIPPDSAHQKSNHHNTFSPESSGNNGANNKSSPKTYARGAALKELKGLDSKSPRDKEERDEYKLFLQQQVEEKRKKEEEAKLKLKLEEEKEAKRIEEQQLKMKEEFEREKELQRKKEEDLRKKNEELKEMAEKKRFEEGVRQKSIEQEMEQELQRQAQLKLERKNEEEVIQVVRTNSPPIPTVAKQQRKKEFERRLSEPKELQQRLQQQHHFPSSTHNGDSAARLPSSSAGPSIAYNSTNYTTPPKEAQQQQQLSSDTEYLNTIRQSMEIQKKINESNVQQQNDLIKQLAILRKQLQSQEKKIHSELQMNKVKYTELRTVGGNPKADDVFSKATKKMNHHDLNYDYNHATSYGRSAKEYGKEVDLKQQRYMRQQEERLATLRKNLAQTDSLSKAKLNNNHNNVMKMRAGSAKSLLDSESQFISLRNHQDITNELQKTSSNGPHVSSSNYGNTTSNNKNTRYSGTARSRRRDKEKENKEVDNIFQEFFPKKEHKNNEPDITSISSFNVEEMTRKNEERLKQFNKNERLHDNNHRNNHRPDDDDDGDTRGDDTGRKGNQYGDADDIVQQFMKNTTQPPNVPELSEHSLPSESKLY